MADLLDKIEQHFAVNKLAFDVAGLSRLVVRSEEIAKELRAQNEASTLQNVKPGPGLATYSLELHPIRSLASAQIAEFADRTYQLAAQSFDY